MALVPRLKLVRASTERYPAYYLTSLDSVSLEIAGQGYYQDFVVDSFVLTIAYFDR